MILSKTLINQLRISRVCLWNVASDTFIDMRAQTILRSGVLDDDDDHSSILYVQAEQTVPLSSLCGWLGGGGGGGYTSDTIVPSDLLFPREASGYRIEQKTQFALGWIIRTDPNRLLRVRV
jgi:hypothetical protein